MLRERSAGVIVFHRDNEESKEENKEKRNNSIKFLFLFKKYKTEYWDLPKGNIETGEEPIETARREAKEETGLENLEFIPSFEKKVSYMYKKDNELVSKEAIYFLAESKSKDVKLSEEHLDFAWLSLEEVLDKVKHKNVANVVKEAYGHIIKAKQL